MQIQINTGHNVEGSEALSSRLTDKLQTTLERFSDRITTAEAYLSDENGKKSGPEDKCCTIEARLEGHQPLAVTNHAATLEQAFDGAADKLIHLIESTLGRLRDKDRHAASQSEPLDRGEIS